MADADTRHARRWIIWLVLGFVVVGLGAAFLLGRNAISDEKQFVGRWTTQLTGYSTSASGATKYEQTAIFTKDGARWADGYPSKFHLIK